MTRALATLLFILSLILALTGCRSDTHVITAAPLPTIPPATAAPTPGPVRVTIDGPVGQPGSYTLPPGSLVDDAVRAAGGPTTDADLARINLAQTLHDSQHVHVPHFGEVLPTPTPYGLGAGGRINVNLAGVDLLQTLPKIGPTTAQRIVEYRETHGPFESIEQIQEVKGIGPATFESLRDLITVAGTP
jgi:competence protein ComEA